MSRLASTWIRQPCFANTRGLERHSPTFVASITVALLEPCISLFYYLFFHLYAFVLHYLASIQHVLSEHKHMSYRCHLDQVRLRMGPTTSHHCTQPAVCVSLVQPASSSHHEPHVSLCSANVVLYRVNQSLALFLQCIPLIHSPQYMRSLHYECRSFTH
jgi:hypothetical protein